MRRLVVALALVAAACGGTRPCKQGTALLALSYGGAATAADALQVTVAVGDQPSRTFTVGRTPGAAADKLEIDFGAGYPAGANLTVSVVATQAGMPVASNAASTPLSGRCATLSLALGAGSGGDGGVKHRGDACAAGDVCDTGFCVDGYCCDTACEGQCQACDVDGAQGTCTLVSGSPHGTRTACASDGTACGGACDGTNPDACVYPTTMCRAASCTGGMSTAAASCDSGACPAPMTSACASGICGATACVTVTQLALGDDFTCALLSDGTVRCWGANDGGQLGQGGTDTDYRYRPTPVPGLTGVTQIAAGNSPNTYGYVCALLSDKTVKCWGGNQYGQLGIGSKDNSPHTTPMPVLTSAGGAALADVRLIAAGGYHTCATIGNSYSPMCWGLDYQGQLCDGTTTDKYFPTQTCSTGSGGTCVALQDIFDMSLGNNHTVFRTLSKAVVGCGDNALGQLGITIDAVAHANPVTAAGVSNAMSVAAGGDDSGAQLSGSTAMTWGQNHKGNLGRGTSTGSSGAATAICDQTCSGTTLGNVAKIVFGVDHACALAGGAVRCWGWNNHGQLGDNSINDENRPATTAIASGAIDVAAGGYHTCAILTDGSVRCWGWDASGQLGDNDMTGTDKKVPVAPVW